MVVEPELDLSKPIDFRHDSIEIAVSSHVSADLALELVQAFLMLKGVEQTDADHAVCWCGEILEIPGLTSIG
ncbi:hypothetical protein OG216_10005 [Streptomycetaceae bacterium NBC_01309]